MRSTDILIIGGGVAGTTAAETYRAGGGSGEVLIVSDEPHRLYSRVLLPHAVKEKIAPEKAFLKTPEWYAEKRVELLARRSVLRVDPKHRRAVLDGGEEIGFEKLLIAVGGKPRAWDTPGAHLSGVLRLQTFDDARAVHEAASAGGHMAIVGSGFIAMEFAAIAINKGMTATLLNRGPHFWTSVLGKTLGGVIEARLKEHGVEVKNSVRAEAALGTTAVTGVRTSSGETIACSMVGVGIGLEIPTTPFGDMKASHGIKANAYLETDHHGIWAAGDCAEFDDEVLGLRHLVGNWTNAVAQGRHVGKALLGERQKFTALTSYTSSVVPGAGLIFLGETKMMPGVECAERVFEAGKKMIEFHLLGGRLIGAVLLNAPDQRAAAASLMQATDLDLSRRHSELSNPAVPLDTFR